LEWCTYHVDDPEPFVDEFDDEFESARSVTICPWDRDFYNVEHEFLFDIILAANYLDIQPCEFLHLPYASKACECSPILSRLFSFVCQYLTSDARL